MIGMDEAKLQKMVQTQVCLAETHYIACAQSAQGGVYAHQIYQWRNAVTTCLLCYEALFMSPCSNQMGGTILLLR